MPLGTLDRTAPPLFNQGPSALSKLIFFSALALFLMVADARFHIVQPVRAAIGAVLYPVQWLALKPVQLVPAAAATSKTCRPPSATRPRRARRWRCSPSAPARPTRWRRKTRGCARCSNCARPRTTPGRAAEVLYDAADPYTRKLVIDQGLTHGIARRLAGDRRARRARARSRRCSRSRARSRW